jgi:hypothetical protein
MKCLHCKSEVAFGYKFCTNCGEKVKKEDMEQAYYNECVWGKFDAWAKKHENSFGKKVMDNFVVKIVVMLISVALIYYGFTSNDYRLHIIDSDVYGVQYDVKSDEYYVLSHKEEFDIQVYVPKFCNSVRLCCYIGEDEKQYTMDANKLNFKVIKGEYDYITVEGMRKDKAVQKIKISFPEY